MLQPYPFGSNNDDPSIGPQGTRRSVHKYFPWAILYLKNHLLVVFRRKLRNEISKDLALTELCGLYRMSKEPNRVPHLAIQPVKSDLFNNDCKGYSVRANTV